MAFVGFFWKWSTPHSTSQSFMLILEKKNSMDMQKVEMPFHFAVIQEMSSFFELTCRLPSALNFIFQL